jgi:hypothetical protein
MPARNPTMAMAPPMMMPRVASETRVPPIAQWTFLGFFLFTLMNIAPLIQRELKFESIPIQPVVFMLTTLIVVPLTRSKPASFYFLFAWIFWLMFAVGGFVGPDRLVGFTDKQLYQLIFKLWISLVGLPLFLLRTINRDKLAMLVKASVLAAVSGAVFAMAQMAFKSRLGRFSSEAGRGAGYWIDPNSCAHALTFFLFLSFAFPFKAKSTNLLVRGLLVFGILSTLSRTGLLLLPLGFLAFAITAKRMRIFFQVGASLAVVVIAANILVTLLQPGTGAGSSLEGEKSNRRLNRFSNMLQGKISDGEKSRMDRSALWSYGWEACMKEPFIGRGHRFMDQVVPIGDGIGPHNYYLFVWGNSGALALISFLLLLFTLFRMSKQCTNADAKPAMMAITTMIACIAMADHAVMNVQFLGCVLAIMVGIHYYYRPGSAGSRVPPGVPGRQPIPPNWAAMPRPRA